MRWTNTEATKKEKEEEPGKQLPGQRALTRRQLSQRVGGTPKQDAGLLPRVSQKCKPANNSRRRMKPRRVCARASLPPLLLLLLLLPPLLLLLSEPDADKEPLRCNGGARLCQRGWAGTHCSQEGPHLFRRFVHFTCRRSTSQLRPAFCSSSPVGEWDLPASVTLV